MARYRAVAEKCIALRDIGEVIGAGLKMPVDSVTPEEASKYLANRATIDLAVSSALTRQRLGWKPTGLDL